MVKVILLIMFLFLLSSTIGNTIVLDTPEGNKLFIKTSEAHCDNGKHNFILVTDILDRTFDLRYNYNVNACIVTEHYLNGNLTKEEYERILYDR